ncbi:V-set and immunoglobulin domain-containing protein 1-like [Hypomesus transpacificus]|uniref:V-set and immunoglobulin domain-containing protein 1-like n=1 Tax=Hypomesus transpacificus TaxID=137520 RepID=UPI001F07AC5E|nr:V-set and immunoglobulin domain-containing protein 1-like [Hypomesus transpacificus]
MTNMLGLVVLLSAMGLMQAISVTTPQKSLNVTVGGSVLLQCSFQTRPPTNQLNIQWAFASKSAGNAHQVYYYQSEVEAIGQPYVNRLTPPAYPNTTMNASITISNMQVSDGGVYTCDVHNFPDIEGKTEASVAVTVLERPTKPFCAVHGDVESGHLVTLTCHSEKGSPAPNYAWTRLGQDQTRRAALGSANIITGVMYIRNLSQFEFGEYQCNASNAVGFDTCKLELVHEIGDGAIVGAVIGALLGCILIALLVWFITHNMKKKKYRAAKTTEANEMKASHAEHTKGSTHQTSVTSRGVTMETPTNRDEDVEA